jgi:hypothetical protein
MINSTTASLSDRASRIAEAEKAALRTASEALGTGRATLEALEKQDGEAPQQGCYV